MKFWKRVFIVAVGVILALTVLGIMALIFTKAIMVQIIF